MKDLTYTKEPSTQKEKSPDSGELDSLMWITWQSYIGNKNYTKAQKDSVKQEFPDHAESWYKNKIRERRKDFTKNYVANLGVTTESDNVSDAAGIAWYAVNNLVVK